MRRKTAQSVFLKKGLGCEKIHAVIPAVWFMAAARCLFILVSNSLCRVSSWLYCPQETWLETGKHVSQLWLWRCCVQQKLSGLWTASSLYFLLTVLWTGSPAGCRLTSLGLGSRSELRQPYVLYSEPRLKGWELAEPCSFMVIARIQ